MKKTIVFGIVVLFQLVVTPVVYGDHSPDYGQCVTLCQAEGRGGCELHCNATTTPTIPAPDEGDLLIDINEIQDNALPNFNFGSTSTLGDILNGILPILFGIVGTALLLYLIAGGFGYLTSGGDPKKMEGAKTIITNAVIGFVLVISAFFITQTVSYVFNLGGGF